MLFHNLNSTAEKSDFFFLNLHGGTFVYGHKFFQILDCHIPDIVFLSGYWHRNINKARKRLEKQVFIALRCIATKHG